MQNENGDPLDDAWRTTTFSSQTTYRATVRFGYVSCFFLLLICGLTALTIFSEECPIGFYEQFLHDLTVGKASVANFLNRNVCSKCAVQDCASC